MISYPVRQGFLAVSVFLLGCLFLPLDGHSDVSAQSMGMGKVGPLATGEHVFKFSNVDQGASVERVELEGEFYLAYSFDLDDATVVALLDQSDTTIYKLSTSSRRFATKVGSRVGDSLLEIYENNPGSFVVAADHGAPEFGLVLPDDEGVFVFDSRENAIDSCSASTDACVKLYGDLKSNRFYTVGT